MDATTTAMSFILDSRLSVDEIVELFRGSPFFLATKTIPANLSPTFEACFIDCQFSWYNSSNWVCLKIEDNYPNKHPNGHEKSSFYARKMMFYLIHWNWWFSSVQVKNTQPTAIHSMPNHRDLNFPNHVPLLEE